MMNCNKLYAVVVFLLGVTLGVDACWSTVCSSNLYNSVRPCDTQGCGSYLASRSGGRKHDGIDITCDPESNVYAPFPATIVRISRPYSSNRGAYNNGLLLRGTGSWSGYEAKMWYFAGTSTRGNVNAGHVIGTSKKLPYSGITQHIHVRLTKNGRSVDPTSFAC